mmetsp:Transcript_859/g.1939  ORF Transcript_859/g.1939 Transcript_859/m.1939 type:complete len:231 (+) Transcript_859:122-814(+)|eukprot:CAMPEP_0206454796 /NCGR_PEP_ID=MMETSP0324_2-20121206/21358_1 /ASSEMBLY_ACC=CAM_ASM_000836 /TAXON_ID=2866 /ORGANISM="Crypthecodinium cohnii, Strain Seligo" /LENGTH=230 /DNA_ID=CAMNT_0053925353 /DNA_START=205 /DNA_END=897 /DNA_ORIENTATION=+
MSQTRLGQPGMGSGSINRVDGAHGVAFRTDLSNIGTSRSGSRLFAGGGSAGVSILDDEKRLIQKVFSIVDKDNSGSVDMQELQDMFKLFGVDSPHLTSAIMRIMTNVDKNFDGQISPDEFYQLLSQKFERDDPDSEKQSVFDRMDRKEDGKLDVDELYEVSQMLGETIPKTEIKAMIKMFHSLYGQEYIAAKAKHDAAKKDPKHRGAIPEEPNPTSIDFAIFKSIMDEEL